MQFKPCLMFLLKSWLKTLCGPYSKLDSRLKSKLNIRFKSWLKYRLKSWEGYWLSKMALCIDLVLIGQQSVRKRSLHLMDTFNAKKRWTTIYWRFNKFLKRSYKVTRLAKKRVSFLKINAINDISFLGTPNCQHCCSIA
jgi:hypothetical protein